MHMQASVYKGKRQSTAEGYLKLSSHRENLHIVPNTHVTKVSFV